MNRIQTRLLVMSLCACSALDATALVAAALPSRPSEGVGPEIVRFLILVIDIDDIDGPAQSFGANIYVRFRWQDLRLAEEGKTLRVMPLEEIWHPRILIANQAGRVQMFLPEAAHVDSGETVTYHQRYVGRFSQPLQLSQFPRDTHEFIIQSVPAGYASDEVVFTPDVYSGRKQVVGGRIAETLSLPDWEILSFSAEARPYEIADTDIHGPGFAVETFTSASDFLEHARLESQTCLILDVRMPGLSGLELQEQLLAAGARLSIVFITAQEDEHARARALRNGATAFLIKPFDDRALLDAIDVALEAKFGKGSLDDS